MEITQRGSVLAGVIGISMVMSMAAGGLLVVASNSRNDEDMVFRRAGCYLDAESALITGAAWLRNHDADSRAFINTNQGWPSNTKILINNLEFENKSFVTLTIVDNAPFPGSVAATTSSMKILTALATHGSESVQFTWDVGTASTGPNSQPDLSLTKWRSP